MKGLFVLLDKCPHPQCECISQHTHSKRNMGVDFLQCEGMDPRIALYGGYLGAASKALPLGRFLRYITGNMCCYALANTSELMEF